MSDNKPMVDTSWELKWKRTCRRKAINILARIENDGKPTQELGYEIRKLHEAFTYWNSDSQDWIKHGMTISLPSNPNDMKENQDGN